MQEYAENIDDVAVDDILAIVDSVSQENVYILEGTVLEVYNDSKLATYYFEEDWPIIQGDTLFIEDLGGF